MRATSRCNHSVLLHGTLATMKAIRWINGEKCAEVWQGSNRYFIALNQIKYA